MTAYVADTTRKSREDQGGQKVKRDLFADMNRHGQTLPVMEKDEEGTAARIRIYDER